MIKSIKYRRLCAIFLDLLIISLLTSLLFNNSISNPFYNEYLEASEKYTEVINNIDYTLITPDNIDSYISNIGTALYNFSKSNVFYYIWYIVLAVFYFGLFQFLTGGKTLGKKFYKIKVVNKENEQKISFIRLLGRSILSGEFFLFDGITIVGLLNILGILFINNITVFFYYIALVNMLGFTYEVILLILFFKDKNGEALHDKFFKTKVIDAK